MGRKRGSRRSGRKPRSRILRGQRGRDASRLQAAQHAVLALAPAYIPAARSPVVMITRPTQKSNIATISVQRDEDAMRSLLRTRSLVIASKSTCSWLPQANGQLSAALVQAAAFRLLRLPGLCHSTSWFSTMCLRRLSRTRTTFFATRSRVAHFGLPNSDAMLRSVLRAAGTVAEGVASGEAHLRVLFLTLGVAENESRGWMCTASAEAPLHERFDTASSFIVRLRALADEHGPCADL